MATATSVYLHAAAWSGQMYLDSVGKKLAVRPHSKMVLGGAA